jgi:hypothetical protein
VPERPYSLPLISPDLGSGTITLQTGCFQCSIGPEPDYTAIAIKEWVNPEKPVVGSGYGDQFVVAAVFVWVIFFAEPWYQFREGLICRRHMSADLNVTLSPLSRGNPFLPEQGPLLRLRPSTVQTCVRFNVRIIVVYLNDI